ncbi:zinc ribbon domain-containing protein [bacterium]|nr:zinc ribbon domain-containing protein [bacterium]
MAPVYEYSCELCHHRFEERVSSHESAAPACPKCGEDAAKKQISRFAVGGQGDLREGTLHGCHGPWESGGGSGHEGHGGCGPCH